MRPVWKIEFVVSQNHSHERTSSTQPTTSSNHGGNQASNQRFRVTVDAAAGVADDRVSRYESLLGHLDSAAQSLQYEVEQEAAEIVALLQRSQAA